MDTTFLSRPLIGINFEKVCPSAMTKGKSNKFSCKDCFYYKVHKKKCTNKHNSGEYTQNSYLKDCMIECCPFRVEIRNRKVFKV